MGFKPNYKFYYYYTCLHSISVLLYLINPRAIGSNGSDSKFSAPKN